MVVELLFSTSVVKFEVGCSCYSNFTRHDAMLANQSLNRASAA